jgi:hypothetical protein
MKSEECMEEDVKGTTVTKLAVMSQPFLGWGGNEEKHK